MTCQAMELMMPQLSKLEQNKADQHRRMREALRLVQAGQSVAEAAKTSELHRLTIERALREAFDRQHVIRQHLQSRAGLTSLLRYPDRGPWGESAYWEIVPAF